jgi:hypothetical protein
MDEFNTSLLREKFIIHDRDAKTGDGKPVIVLSNRLEASLKSKNGKREEYAVRAHNMHLCVRMVARLMLSFHQGGPLLERQTPFDWESVWDMIVSDYEYAYNAARWIAIYHKGRVVFEKGTRHPLVDIIEKCDIVNKTGIYDESVKMAEKAFRDAGKNVRIEYDANVALVVSVEDNAGRFAIILRGAQRTTTFNFSARSSDDKKKINVPQCLGVAAAFLEGVQLAFAVGMNNEKIRIGLIERHSKEEKQTRDAAQRLNRLATEIGNLENTFEVRYRPEKPEFHMIVVDAEQFAQKVLVPPEKKGKKDDPGDKKIH